MYRDAAEAADRPATNDQLAWSNSIYIAETDEKAMREAKPHLEALTNRFLKMPIEMLLPPGYTSVESMKRIRAAKVVGKVVGKVQTAEDLVNSGVVLVGSPSTVREKLEEYQELAGFNNSLTKTSLARCRPAKLAPMRPPSQRKSCPIFGQRRPQKRQLNRPKRQGFRAIPTAKAALQSSP
jgi:hypothetical protein